MGEKDDNKTPAPAAETELVNLEAQRAEEGQVSSSSGDVKQGEDTTGAVNIDDVPVSFDWAVYVDATLAGLSVLIPFPFVDNIFERYFRRRMIGAIANRRDVVLTKKRISMVNNRYTICGIIWDCITFPFFIIFEIVASLFKVVFYFLAVKKSTDALNYYWQKAFLLDYILQRGYLSVTDQQQAEASVVAMERLLDDVGSSPLKKLATKIIYKPCKIFCSLILYVCCCGCVFSWCGCCKNNNEDDAIDQTQATMSESWTSFSGYFQSLAQRYEEERSEILDHPESIHNNACFCC